MPTRKYKADKDKLIAECQDFIRSTDDAKLQHKVEIVLIVLGGMAPSELSKYVKESKNTITAWVKSADENGIDSLRTKKQPGRQPRLTPEQEASIKRTLEADNPQASGYQVWDGPSLSDYIQKSFGVFLGVRQCQRLFHKLGFSLVVPQPFPCKNKDGLEEEREAFKKNNIFRR